MRKTILHHLPLYVLLTLLGCRASPDWNGTWKLNIAKSSFEGQVLTISVLADGEYRFEGVNSSHNLRCDGKDEPLGKNRTRVCTKSGAAALDIIQKKNGVTIGTTRDELSNDLNTLTTTIIEYRPNGSVVTAKTVFSRLSGAKDLAGKWRNVSYIQQHADMFLKLDNKVLHIDYPLGEQYIDAPLNGTETTVHERHAPEEATIIMRPMGSHKIAVTTKYQGRVFSRGYWKLSNDGRTIVSSWWSPDRPTNVGTLVYEKNRVP